MTQKWKDNHNCRGSPQGARRSHLTSDTPGQGVQHQEDEPPEHFGFEGQPGFCSGVPEGCEKQTPFLKGTHKISRPLRLRQKQQSESSHVRATSWSRRASWRAGGPGTPAGGVDAGGKSLGVHRTMRTLGLASDAVQSLLQLTSTRTQPGSPASQHQSWAPMPSSELPGDTAPPTGGLAAVTHLHEPPQPPGTQPDPFESLGPGPAHQQASTSPKTDHSHQGADPLPCTPEQGHQL